MQQLQQNDDLLRRVCQRPDDYQFCFSNYSPYYSFGYCTWRYFRDATLTQLDSDHEHLLKHIERIKHHIHERELISQRTQAALDTKRAQGAVLGNPEKLTPDAQAKGVAGNVRRAALNPEQPAGLVDDQHNAAGRAQLCPDCGRTEPGVVPNSAKRTVSGDAGHAVE